MIYFKKKIKYVILFIYSYVFRRILIKKFLGKFFFRCCNCIIKEGGFLMFVFSSEIFLFVYKIVNVNYCFFYVVYK